MREGGTAGRGGLSPGDVVIALEGLRVNSSNLAERLARHEEGDEVEVAYFRGDELLHSKLTMLAALADTCHLALASDAAARVLERRRDWLGE